MESWVYNTGIAFNRQRQEWERGNHTETKEELGDAGLEEGWDTQAWTSHPWDAAPSWAPREVAGAYSTNSDSHSWWGEPGLDNLISLFHL